MNVTPINNTSQPKFNGAFRVSIPKSIMPKNCDEDIAKTIFANALNVASKTSPKRGLNKVLTAIGIDKDAVAYMNYPGYERLRPYIQENGKTWTETRLNYRYNLFGDNMQFGLGLKIPEANPENYEFVMLTGLEKDCFLSCKKEIDEEAKFATNRAVNNIFARGNDSIEERDYQLLKDLTLTGIENQAFVVAANARVQNVKINKLEELSVILSKLIKL